MKKYQKAQMIAKNLPTGSYAAGCPAKGTAATRCLFSKDSVSHFCKYCERSQ